LTFSTYEMLYQRLGPSIL